VINLSSLQIGVVIRRGSLAHLPRGRGSAAKPAWGCASYALPRGEGGCWPVIGGWSFFPGVAIALLVTCLQCSRGTGSAYLILFTGNIE